MLTRRRRALAAFGASVLMVLGSTTPSQALAYAYFAGHPMWFGGPGWGGLCTGGYTIHGTSGMFIVTAGHCAYGDSTPNVYGTGAKYGVIAHRHYDGNMHGSAGDSALVSMSPGVVAYQSIMDNDGQYPGDGKITGIMPTSEQKLGVKVGLMGYNGDWMEGYISSYHLWMGRPVICVDYPTKDGDSGGPVWRLDSKGLRAVGIHVMGDEDPDTYGCYLPIEQVLAEWGAGMNVWPRSTALRAASPTVRITVDEPSPFPTDLPMRTGPVVAE